MGQSREEIKQEIDGKYKTLEASTAEVIAANVAYKQWSLLRLNASKIVGRFTNTQQTSDEAYEPLIVVVELATRKMEAIEAYIAKKRAMHETINNQIEELEGRLAGHE